MQLAIYESENFAFIISIVFIYRAKEYLHLRVDSRKPSTIGYRKNKATEFHWKISHWKHRIKHKEKYISWCHYQVSKKCENPPPWKWTHTMDPPSIEGTHFFLCLIASKKWSFCLLSAVWDVLVMGSEELRIMVDAMLYYGYWGLSIGIINKIIDI